MNILGFRGTLHTPCIFLVHSFCQAIIELSYGGWGYGNERSIEKVTVETNESGTWRGGEIVKMVKNVIRVPNSLTGWQALSQLSRTDSGKSWHLGVRCCKVGSQGKGRKP